MLVIKYKEIRSYVKTIILPPWKIKSDCQIGSMRAIQLFYNWIGRNDCRLIYERFPGFLNGVSE